jgi:hypothetical protein
MQASSREVGCRWPPQQAPIIPPPLHACCDLSSAHTLNPPTCPIRSRRRRSGAGGSAGRVCRRARPPSAHCHSRAGGRGAGRAVGTCAPEPPLPAACCWLLAAARRCIASHRVSSRPTQPHIPLNNPRSHPLRRRLRAGLVARGDARRHARAGGGGRGAAARAARQLGRAGWVPAYRWPLLPARPGPPASPGPR